MPRIRRRFFRPPFSPVASVASAALAARVARVARVATVVTLAAGATAMVAGTALAAGISTLPPAPGVSAPPARAVVVGPVRMLSRDCAGSSAEVEEAADAARGYVYELWMGCGNGTIAFARSRDGGDHFSRPLILRDSGGGSWDPALTVSPSGTVYAAFMTTTHNRTFPVVEASFDHGRSFPQVAEDSSVPGGNWGDRDFIAAGSGGLLYLSWDYGPWASKVRYICPPGGSCSFSAGDLNIVVQRSTDGGRTWGPLVHVSPGFPASGGDSAPLVVEPGGQLDVLYQGCEVVNRATYALGPCHEYFTRSTDGAATWSPPRRVGPARLDQGDSEWWIDGSLGLDAGGNLYATFDTQGRTDIGWLSASTDHGRTWSPLVRVTADRDRRPHIVEVVGGPAGWAVVSILAGGPQAGYALAVRAFCLATGRVGRSIAVSSALGSRRVWPGDTTGLAALPARRRRQRVVVSWGSAVAVPSSRSSTPPDEIFAARVQSLP